MRGVLLICWSSLAVVRAIQRLVLIIQWCKAVEAGWDDIMARTQYTHSYLKICYLRKDLTSQILDLSNSPTAYLVFIFFLFNMVWSTINLYNISNLILYITSLWKFFPPSHLGFASLDFFPSTIYNYPQNTTI